MAKIISELAASRRRMHKAFYPWAEWLDGQIREFKRGEDFNGPVRNILPRELTE